MRLSSDLVRSVLESAPDAMIIIDGSGTVLFANRQVSALFGYDSSEVIDQPVEMLLPERFRARHVAHRAGYAGAVRPMGTGLDLFARRKDGTEFAVEISLSPIQQQDGIMVAAAIRDITERAYAEQELRDAQAAADRASLAKSRFLAAASHDLRQPLHALALLNGTLRRLVSEGKAREVLDQQEQMLGTMSHLLNALLDISKLESGAMKPDITDFSVARLLEELRREFAGLARDKGLDLVVETTSARARSDPTLLGQALTNLVANAIKYTSTGGVRLRTSALASTVRIEVCDTGCGIDAEHLPFVFDEFYQAGAAAGAAGDGYGLGLSIVQRVVGLLGLRIDVSSRPGEGSTFALEIPSGALPAEEVVAPGNGKAIAARGGGAARHVLLVEDDAGVRNATRLLLKSEAFRVSTAASFEESLAHFDQHPDIELVISDYHLGGGRTGADVVAAARVRFGPAFPAILVTGDTTPAVVQLPRDDRLQVTRKPINADDLLGMIHSLLGH